ncbi:hypothetical protein C0J52_05158 [Blattella germanica]|nr:hypothetical protein C0J52_05158 [Blattella germanica]
MDGPRVIDSLWLVTLKLYDTKSFQMKTIVFLSLLSLCSSGNVNKKLDKRGVLQGGGGSDFRFGAHGFNHGGGFNTVTLTNQVPVPIPQQYHIPVQSKVPTPVPQPVPIPVSQPYPARIPQPASVPVEKHVPVTVEKPVPVPGPQPVPYAVPKHVGVPVPTPVPVHISKPVPVPVPHPVAVPKQVQIIIRSPGYSNGLGLGQHGGLILGPQGELGLGAPGGPDIGLQSGLGLGLPGGFDFGSVPVGLGYAGGFPGPYGGGVPAFGHGGWGRR